MLSVHVVPEVEGVNTSYVIGADEKRTVEIQDVLRFRSRLAMYPLVEPANRITRRGVVEEADIS